MRNLFRLSVLLFTGYVSCGGGPPSPDSPGSFFSTMTSLKIEVVYEPGAEPFVGDTPVGGRKIWDILEDNLKEIFKNREVASHLTIPKELSAMTAIADQTGPFSVDDILGIAAANRTTASTSTAGSFFVLFLDGYYEENGSANQNVIGVSLTGTTIIAIFKPVVVSSSVTQAVQKFVEQSTLVHEMGHALGLVNNGVPMISDHQDPAHGKHCDNDQCVMYYLNEGASDAVAFVQKFLTQSTFVMFAEDCLRDAQSYRP